MGLPGPELTRQYAFGARCFVLDSLLPGESVAVPLEEIVFHQHLTQGDQIGKVDAKNLRRTKAASMPLVLNGASSKIGGPWRAPSRGTS